MSQGRWEKESLERPVTTRGQLLVEGKVPGMFFREMIIAYGLTKLVEVRTFGDISKNNLQTYLEIFTAKAVFKERVKALGVIRDAETKPADSAFQSVCGALRGAKLSAPAGFGRFEREPLAVGVFILPNCRDAGMLETLCLQAAENVEQASGSKLLPCVDEFFACLEKRGQVPANPQKARFAGYALAQDIIDPQLGRAAQQGKIPWVSPAFNLWKEFLNQFVEK